MELPISLDLEEGRITGPRSEAEREPDARGTRSTARMKNKGIGREKSVGGT